MSFVKSDVLAAEGSIGADGDTIGSKLLSVIKFISLLVKRLVMDTRSKDGELNGVSVNNIEVSKTECVDTTVGSKGSKVVTVKLLIEVVDVTLTLLMLSAMEVTNDTSNVSLISKLGSLVSTSDVADDGITALDKLSIVIASVNSVIG